MAGSRVRPRPGESSFSRESSFESDTSDPATPSTNHTKLTVDTSSLTSLDTSQWHLANEDPVAVLRRSVAGYERREERLNSHIARIQKELEASRENAKRWKQAVKGDVRPGTQYRKEIALLMQKLEKKDSIIQEREITIDNLMAGNHPSHPLLILKADGHDESVCSPLLEEAAEPSPAQEIERLLSENSKYAQQLREKDKELKSVRRKLSESFSSDRHNESMDSMISVPFDPFEDSLHSRTSHNMESADNSSVHSESIRMTKRVMELNYELSKMTKDRNSSRRELEQSQVEASRLRSELCIVGSHSERIKDMVAELKETKLALHKTEIRAENATSALNSHKAMIRDMKVEMRKRNSAIFELRRVMKKKQTANHSMYEDEEVEDLKKALHESLEELENVTKVVSEQKQTIQDLKTASEAKDQEIAQLQETLRVETANLQDTKRKIMKNDSNVRELDSSKTENEGKVSDDVEILKKKVEQRDEELKRLRQDSRTLESKNDCLRRLLVEKEVEITKLSVSMKEASSTLNKEGSSRVEVKVDRSDSDHDLKRDYERLLKKTECQTKQLLDTDKVLFAKECEKNALKTSLKELREKLENLETQKRDDEDKMKRENERLRRRLSLKTERNDHDSRIIGEKDTVISDLEVMRNKLKSSLNKNLLDQDTMMDSVVSLKEDLQEKTRENSQLQETIRARGATISSLSSRIEEIEKQVRHKDEKILEYENSNAELRTRLKNCLFKEVELGKKERHLEDLKQRNGEDQHLSQDRGLNRETIKQIKEQIHLKDSFIARLLESQEGARESLKQAHTTQAQMREELKVMEANVSDLLETKEKLLSDHESINMKDKIVELQNQIENITSKKNDKEYEMDILLNKFAQLSESNQNLEEKYEFMGKHLEEVSNETLQLQEELDQNCDMVSVKRYFKILQDVFKLESDADKDTSGESTMSEDLRKARAQFVNELNCLQQDRKSLERRETELEEKKSEIMRLTKVEDENHSLKKMVAVHSNAIQSERQEKEDIARERNNLMRQSNVIRENLESMEETNKRLEKNIKDLERDVVRSNDLMAENEEFQKKNANMKEEVHQLSKEVEDLKQKLLDRTNENEMIASLRKDIEKAKMSENEKVNSYERQISSLTMNKDVTIDTLRNDLASSRSRSAEEIARLTSELSELQGLKIDLERRSSTIGMKDQKIHTLERTLYAQEKTVESLRCELDQVQLTMRNASEQRRKDFEDLQKDLIESKSRAMNQDREYTILKAKLDECKVEHEKEIESLSEEMERLKKDPPMTDLTKELRDTTFMLEAKQRLEQLRVVNIELKEDNIQLSAKLERALIKIQGLEEENEKDVEIENECAQARKQLKDLECILEENFRQNNPKFKAKAKKSILDVGKGKGKGGWTKHAAWGKSEVPSILYIDTIETLSEGSD